MEKDDLFYPGIPVTDIMHVKKEIEGLRKARTKIECTKIHIQKQAFKRWEIETMRKKKDKKK